MGIYRMTLEVKEESEDKTKDQLVEVEKGSLWYHIQEGSETGRSSAHRLR